MLLDYGFKRFETSEMVRLDIMINGERVDALAIITHKENAQYRGRQVVEDARADPAPDVRHRHSGLHRQ